MLRGSSWLLALSFSNYRPGNRGRFFVNASTVLGRYPAMQVYVDGNPAFPNFRSGSNESDPNDFLLDDGRNLLGRVELEAIQKLEFRASFPFAIAGIFDKEALG